MDRAASEEAGGLVAPTDSLLTDQQMPWRDSPEWRAVRVWQQILWFLTVLGTAAAVMLWMAIMSESLEAGYQERSVSTALWVVASLVTVCASCVALGAFAQRGVARRKFEDRIEQERREELRANRDKQVEPGELGDLMSANRALLDEYQKPVRAQARTSYVYGQVAIFVGFGVLVVGVALVLLADSPTAQVSLAGLAAVGSAISSYVARTFLRVYDRAQQQLNFYFREPLITSYLLTSERLAEKLQGERREHAYSLMVEEIIRFAKVGIDPDRPTDG